MLKVVLSVMVCLTVLGCGSNLSQENPQGTSVPITSQTTSESVPSSGYQNCYCYETEEVTGVLTLTERGSSYTKLYIGNTTLRVYDEFWAAGSYSWQGVPKELGLSVGSKYYIKVRTKYSIPCVGAEERDYSCGSWKSPCNTEILEARIISE